MSDLSNLLGNVYGSRDPDGPSTRHEPAADARAAQVPDWADEEKLDNAFADWTPGEPPSAGRKFGLAAPAAPAQRAPLDDDLAAALSAALVEAAAVPAVEPEPARPVADLPSWSVADPVPAPVAPAPQPLLQQPVAPFVPPVAAAPMAAAPAPAFVAPAPRPVAPVFPTVTPVAAAPVAPVAPVAAPVMTPQPVRMWQFGDDDIVPGAAGREAAAGKHRGKGRGKGRRSRRAA